MSTFDNDFPEEEYPTEDSKPDSKQFRQYEIVMKSMDPKMPQKRETYLYHGLLGLNPDFVIVQNEEGFLSFASEWCNVWTVRAVPTPSVISLLAN